MNTLLGIDFGKRKVGLAISSGSVAVPLVILENNIGMMDELKKIIEQEKIVKIILGLPTGLQNQTTQATEEVLVFQKDLENNIDIPVETFDERLTSQQAQRMGSGSQDDAHAAALVLQSYIDGNVSI